MIVDDHRESEVFLKIFDIVFLDRKWREFVSVLKQSCGFFWDKSTKILYGKIAPHKGSKITNHIEFDHHKPQITATMLPLLKKASKDHRVFF